MMPFIFVPILVLVMPAALYTAYSLGWQHGYAAGRWRRDEVLDRGAR